MNNRLILHLRNMKILLKLLYIKDLLIRVKPFQIDTIGICDATKMTLYPRLRHAHTFTYAHKVICTA